MLLNRSSTPLRRVLPAALLALAGLLLCFVPGASAADPTVELRVEGPEGKIDPGSRYVLPTGKISAPLARNETNCEPRAEAKRESYPQRSALGVALNGAAQNPDLAGTRIQSFSFGPLLCRFAGLIGEEFNPDTGEYSGWNGYVNSEGGVSSADQFPAGPGDSVAWAFTDQDNLGNLELVRQPSEGPDGTQTVRVILRGFDNVPAPTDDATIVGADSQQSLGDGRYAVEIDGPTRALYATQEDYVDSNQLFACAEGLGLSCDGATLRSYGTAKADEIGTTVATDIVRAGAGNDRVIATSGGGDRINCGAGREDVVVVDRGAPVKTTNCERTRGKG